MAEAMLLSGMSLDIEEEKNPSGFFDIILV